MFTLGPGFMVAAQAGGAIQSMTVGFAEFAPPVGDYLMRSAGDLVGATGLPGALSFRLIGGSAGVAVAHPGFQPFVNFPATTNYVFGIDFGFAVTSPGAGAGQVQVNRLTADFVAVPADSLAYTYSVNGGARLPFAIPSAGGAPAMRSVSFVSAALIQTIDFFASSGGSSEVLYVDNLVFSYVP